MTGSEGLGGGLNGCGCISDLEEAESRHFRARAAASLFLEISDLGEVTQILRACFLLSNGNSNTGHLRRAFGDFDERIYGTSLHLMNGGYGHRSREKELVRRCDARSQGGSVCQKDEENETAEAKSLRR